MMRDDDTGFPRSVLASVVADDEDKFGSSRVPTPQDAAEKIVGFMVVKYKGPRSRVKISAYDAEVRCQLNTMATKDALKELHLHELTVVRAFRLSEPIAATTIGNDCNRCIALLTDGCLGRLAGRTILSTRIVDCATVLQEWAAELETPGIAACADLIMMPHYFAFIFAAGKFTTFIQHEQMKIMSATEYQTFMRSWPRRRELAEEEEAEASGSDDGMVIEEIPVDEKDITDGGMLRSLAESLRTWKECIVAAPHAEDNSDKLKKYLMWLDSNADRLDCGVLRPERFDLQDGKGGFLDQCSGRRVQNLTIKP